MVFPCLTLTDFMSFLCFIFIAIPLLRINPTTIEIITATTATQEAIFNPFSIFSLVNMGFLCVSPVSGVPSPAPESTGCWEVAFVLFLAVVIEPPPPPPPLLEELLPPEEAVVL